MSISACDIRVSMLLSLLLANITILSCFFFFSLVISNFLTIPAVREKNKVILALAIPTGAPTILVNEMIDTPLLVALKTIKAWSIQSKTARYSLNFLLHDFLWLIFLIK